MHKTEAAAFINIYGSALRTLALFLLFKYLQSLVIDCEERAVCKEPSGAATAAGSDLEGHC